MTVDNVVQFVTEKMAMKVEEGHVILAHLEPKIPDGLSLKISGHVRVMIIVI